MHNYFCDHCGAALDPETGHWRGTFPTFVKEGQNWKYCGNCFIGKTTPPPAPIRR